MNQACPACGRPGFAAVISGQESTSQARGTPAGACLGYSRGIGEPRLRCDRPASAAAYSAWDCSSRSRERRASRSVLISPMAVSASTTGMAEIS